MADLNNYFRKTWMKLGVGGRLVVGIVIILAGTVFARIIIDCMLQTGNFMIHPDNEDRMFRYLFWIPLSVYEIFYIVVYGWCAGRGTRDAAIYKILWLLFFVVIIVELGILIAVSVKQGFWMDAKIFIYVGYFCSTVMFGVAFFGVKPF